MSWVLVEEEHYRGSSDPYVARTTLQAGYLSSYFQLGEDKDLGIVGVFDRYRRHLHQCNEISQRIISEITEHSKTLELTMQYRRDGETLRLPSVRNLTNDIENFCIMRNLRSES